jgi:ribosomal protein L29
MVAKKKAPAKASAKKAPAKKAKTETKAPVKKEASKKVSLDLSALDRKGLATKARELKKELLAIRFNLSSPSLKDYKKKRSELAAVLAQLG